MEQRIGRLLAVRERIPFWRQMIKQRRCIPALRDLMPCRQHDDVDFRRYLVKRVRAVLAMRGNRCIVQPWITIVPAPDNLKTIGQKRFGIKPCEVLSQTVADQMRVQRHELRAEARHALPQVEILAGGQAFIEPARFVQQAAFEDASMNCNRAIACEDRKQISASFFAANEADRLPLRIDITPAAMHRVRIRVGRERRHHPRHHIGVDQIVGIEKEEPFAIDMGKRRVAGSGCVAALRAVDYRDSCVLGGEFFAYRSGRIRRAIVYDNHPPSLSRLRNQGIERLRNRLPGIARRHDDRDDRIGSVIPPLPRHCARPSRPGWARAARPPRFSCNSRV